MAKRVVVKCVHKSRVMRGSTLSRSRIARRVGSLSADQTASSRSDSGPAIDRRFLALLFICDYKVTYKDAAVKLQPNTTTAKPQLTRCAAPSRPENLRRGRALVEVAVTSRRMLGRYHLSMQCVGKHYNFARKDSVQKVKPRKAGALGRWQKTCTDVLLHREFASTGDHKTRLQGRHCPINAAQECTGMRDDTR